MLSLIVLVASFFVINFLRGRDVFNRELELKGRFADVEGLVASAPVYVLGYAAGHVNEVNYNRQTNDFEVVCSVKKDFLIPKDSKMVIYATSLMGTKGVRIEPGTSDAEAVDGEFLLTGSEPDLVGTLTAMLYPLSGRINGALDSLTLVLSNVNDVLCEQNKASIKASLEHLDATLLATSELARNLGGKSEEINAIVDNLSQLSSKLGPIADGAEITMGNLAELSAGLKDAQIGKTVENIGNAAGTLDKTLQQVSGPLDSLLNNVDQLVKSIQDNPKKYIKITVF